MPKEGFYWMEDLPDELLPLFGTREYTFEDTPSLPSPVKGEG